MAKGLDLWLCDARASASLQMGEGSPIITPLYLPVPSGEVATIGMALMRSGLASGPNDPSFSRKGCFGVFGKRKEWHSPIYDGDRIELYGPLLIDPKAVRRKKANQNRDSELKASALARQARREAKQR